MNILKTASIALGLFLFILPAKSQNKDPYKLAASNEVLSEFSKIKESIPEEIFNVAEGIVIIPNMKNLGFVVAGKRGKGIAMIKNTNGTWSDPLFVTLTGGSVGLQAGVQSIDLVLIFKRRETLANIHNASFTLGGDVSITAGPVGRNSTASTDTGLEAEAYSYSKSKGLFAGISLSGASLSVDEKAILVFYGKKEDVKTVFKEGHKSTSAEAKTLNRTVAGLFR